DRLQQVLWNLLINAVKFTPHAGRAHVRLRRGETAAEIIVSDSGEGIAADVLPYVFDRFRQEDSSATRAHAGLGLGLALVRPIMAMSLTMAWGCTRVASATASRALSIVVTSAPQVVSAAAKSSSTSGSSSTTRTRSPTRIRCSGAGRGAGASPRFPGRRSSLARPPPLDRTEYRSRR